MANTDLEKEGADLLLKRCIDNMINLASTRVDFNHNEYAGNGTLYASNYRKKVKAMNDAVDKYERAKEYRQQFYIDVKIDIGVKPDMDVQH